MSFDYIRKIPIKEEIINSLSLTEEVKDIKEKRDKELREIFVGESDKFIIIIGPCSADREDAVMDYIKRLSKVNEKVKDKIYIIPRIYTNKPRTNGEGYKGMLHQPDLDKEPDLINGIKTIRRLYINILKETGLTAADEMLYPEILVYFEDLIGYNAIGSRSVENQGHRLVASGLETPIGMKNSINGDLRVMLNSINAAQKNHKFIYDGWEVKTNGNNFAHGILRGYVNKKGECIPNYYYEDLLTTIDLYKNANLKNEAIIVDVSHSNSNKDYRQQQKVAKDVLCSIKSNDEIKKYVKGLMIESYIVEGSQKTDENRVYGKSVTDGCIGWEETEELLYYIYENI